MATVPLFTFKVDGEEHFRHGTLEACLGLIAQWGSEQAVRYEIIPYVPDPPSSLEERIERLADGIKAQTEQFMADYEKSGEGLSVRMSGETAAMIVAERSQIEGWVRALLTEET